VEADMLAPDKSKAKRRTRYMRIGIGFVHNPFFHYPMDKASALSVATVLRSGYWLRMINNKPFACSATFIISQAA
jgi:hypothetical protein